MPKIDTKVLKAACEAYDNNSCGQEAADDTGMWAAIEAYEAAKAAEQPVEWGTAFETWWQTTDDIPLPDLPFTSKKEWAKAGWDAAMATKRESIDLKDAEIAAWRTLANAKVRVKWRRGLPADGGMYLVRLADGEMCVTPWNDGKGKNKDSWGDDRKTGWTCLTDSQSTVKAWINVEDLRTLPCDSLISQEQGRRGSDD